MPLSPVDEEITLPLRLVVAGDTITLDFEGAPPQLARGGVNSTLNYTAAHATYPLKCMLTPAVRGNAGCYRPFTVRAPEGSILNCTRPAAVAARTRTGWYLAPAVFRALAEAAPDLVQSPTGLPVAVNVSGRDADGTPYADHLFMGGGQGASTHGDGKSGLLYPTSAANTAVEVFEARVPVLVEEKCFLPDSGGAGRTRGGLAQRVRFRKLHDDGLPTLAALFPEGARAVLPGLAGGRAGAHAFAGVRAPDGTLLHDCGTGELVTLTRATEVAELVFAGGAGHGDPRARPARSVAADLQDGRIGEDEARDAYGADAAGRGGVAGAEQQSMDSITPARTAVPANPRHPTVLEPATLVLLAVLCVVGAIIGMQLLVTLGVTANTSIVGALVAMGLARVPLRAFTRYRSIHVQNLAQSAISAATFGAGNSLLLPIGIPFLMGRQDLVLPLLGGVALAMLVDATMLYRMFGSRAFPAEGAWPPGVAAAEAIRAGDEGGGRLLLLGGGVVAGIAGSGFLGIPMSAFGVAFIGNVWALTMFGLGLLLRGYAPLLFSGMLPGGRHRARVHPARADDRRGAGGAGAGRPRDDGARGPARERPGRGSAGVLGLGAAAYLAVAALIALGGGLAGGLSAGMLVAFVVYAAFAALIHELIVGLAAMHSGWFPAFAVALITLIVGMLIGFPPVPLALLVGFSAATGPAFADMGYDLKAGFMLRGEGADPAFEADGRFQQYVAAMFAFVVAGLVVLVSYKGYFAANLVAPVAKVYVATIKAGATPGVAWQLLVWAVPGALLQLLGGPKRQMGVLFATGMLIVLPVAGWAVLAGVACRLLYGRLRGPRGRSEMEVVAGGIIAGDALTGFCTGVLSNLRR